MQPEYVFGIDTTQQQQHFGKGRTPAGDGPLSGTSRYASQHPQPHQPSRRAAIGTRGEFGMFLIQD